MLRKTGELITRRSVRTSPAALPRIVSRPHVIVGVPKEIKRDEYRVAILPVGVEELTRAGHQVLVEVGAGLGSGLTDQAYEASGARLVASVNFAWLALQNQALKTPRSSATISSNPCWVSDSIGRAT